jgi:shikimate kinase
MPMLLLKAESLLRSDILERTSPAMRILLTGVSCVGKSTIGPELATLLGIPFFDLDYEVEAFFQDTIPRIQARYASMNGYRAKVCRVLKAILSRTDANDCVIALPPSGLMAPYWNAIKASRSTLVVVQDDPINILNRIIFLDDDNRLIHKQLSPKERALYLEEIKKDMKYYARSYAKAQLKVHIKGLGPVEAAKQIKLALDPIQG